MTSNYFVWPSCGFYHRGIKDGGRFTVGYQFLKLGKTIEPGRKLTMQLTPTQIDEFNTRGVLIARDALTHGDQQPHRARPPAARPRTMRRPRNPDPPKTVMRFIGFLILRNSNGPAISPPNEITGIPRNDPLPIKAAARTLPLPRRSSMCFGTTYRSWTGYSCSAKCVGL